MEGACLKQLSAFFHLSRTHILQVLFLSVLALAGHSLFLPYMSTEQLFRLLSCHKILVFSFVFCFAVSLFFYLSTRPRPVLLLNYSCYRPSSERRCSYEICEYFLRRNGRFSEKSEEFMKGIYNKSGLGDETYGPNFIFGSEKHASHDSAVEELTEGMYATVESVLKKTGVPVSLVDTVIVSCGMFAPSPSLSSFLVNRFGFDPAVKTYNLGGMGCGSGAISIDLASRLMSSSRRLRYALVIVTESVSLNWYFGSDRSMLVTNCIFRAGCAAVLLTNDPSRRSQAKLRLLRSFRTNEGADDLSYRAAYQGEDEEGLLGVSLKKDLIRVAGEGLKKHIRILGLQVLPLSQLLQYAYNLAAAYVNRENKKPNVPDFTTAFEHICIHTGGKAVIQSVGRLMNFSDEITEPARMTLHRFGNTSSSLIFYEFAYFEAKDRIKKGEKVWMLGFGTGFKVCSLVWKSLSDSKLDTDNPWVDCIHRYPLKAW